MPLPKQHEVDIWNRALSRVGDSRITLQADVAVTSVSAAAPPAAVTAAHGFSTGDRALLFDMTGGAEINGRVFRVVVTGATGFTLYREDGSTNAAATGGLCARLPDTKIERACFDAWPEVRDEVIRAHPWNSTTKRGRLARLASAKTITGITAANPAVVTSATHGYSDGDLVLIENVVGMTELNGRYFTVANQATNTFELSGEDSSLYTAYASAGTAKKALQPLKADFGYAYRYQQPADCLRVLELADDPLEAWELEGQEVLTDAGITVPIRYCKRVSDPSLWDPQLTNVMVARLALEICQELSDSTSLRDTIEQEYKDMLSAARGQDAQEQSPQDFVEDDWVLAHSDGFSSVPRLRSYNTGPR